MKKEQLAKWREAIAALPEVEGKYDGEPTTHIAYPCYFCKHYDGNEDYFCHHPLDVVSENADENGLEVSVSCWGFEPMKRPSAPIKLTGVAAYWDECIAYWDELAMDREEWEREDVAIPHHISADTDPKTLAALGVMAHAAQALMEQAS